MGARTPESFAEKNVFGRFGVAQRNKNVFTHFYKQAEEQLVAISLIPSQSPTLKLKWSCKIFWIIYTYSTMRSTLRGEVYDLSD